MVQRLRLYAPSAGGTVSILGPGTKIPHATWRGQKNKMHGERGSHSLELSINVGEIG